LYGKDTDKLGPGARQVPEVQLWFVSMRNVPINSNVSGYWKEASAWSRLLQGRRQGRGDVDRTYSDSYPASDTRNGRGDDLNSAAVGTMSTTSLGPPDGGWGWVVVFASFVCTSVVDGVCNSYGLFLPHIMAYFGESRAKSSLAGSLMAGGFLSVGE